MKHPPTFQLYTDRWLASTKIALMTPAEEGAYIRLLCHLWNSDGAGLPDDDDQLATLSRLGKDWKGKSAKRLRDCFVARDGRLYSPLMDELWTNAQERRSKAAASAGYRWNNANAMRTHSERNANGMLSRVGEGEGEGVNVSVHEKGESEGGSAEASESRDPLADKLYRQLTACRSLAPLTYEMFLRIAQRYMGVPAEDAVELILHEAECCTRGITDVGRFVNRWWSVAEERKMKAKTTTGMYVCKL